MEFTAVTDKGKEAKKQRVDGAPGHGLAVMMK